MCEYCNMRDPLDSTASKWLFDEIVDMSIVKVAFGGVIMPEKNSSI